MHNGLFLFLNMSGGEMLVIALVFLMLFGSKNIPDIARTMGKAMRQFKDATGEIQRDIESSTRDFRSRIEQETRQISDGLDPDKLAGSSTPPPAVPPKKEEPVSDIDSTEKPST